MSRSLHRAAVVLLVVAVLAPSTALATPAAGDPIPGGTPLADLILAHTTRAEAAKTRAEARAKAEQQAKAEAERKAEAAQATTAEARAASVVPTSSVTPPAVPVAAPAAAPAALQGFLASKGEPGTVFATVAGQDLVLPNRTVAVGFHEASSRSALPLLPVGTPTANHNAGRVTLPEASAENRYLVLPTRRRGTSALSAADLRIDPGLSVASVVTGTVTRAGDYALYGRTTDSMVEIQSAKNPDLRILMLHVEGLRVQPGDTVVAGETVVADTTRQLPFASQIDRFSNAGPHVHVEVRHHPQV